ncbi:Hypothetical protein CINCED_3A009887 [Cinara cedri]|uniref:Uncharacterized protein n=1 Tax=Cinara cedri TaxID=506608 RepID=A0A5E4M7H7_9HEMI|nr:Hypothetical protein CINCED_3A009887 [Cinara cedri]
MEYYKDLVPELNNCEASIEFNKCVNQVVDAMNSQIPKDAFRSDPKSIHYEVLSDFLIYLDELGRDFKGGVVVSILFFFLKLLILRSGVIPSIDNASRIQSETKQNSNSETDANDTSRSKNYITFSGKCKDRGADAIGLVDKKPDEAMLLVTNICLTGVDLKCKYLSKRPLNAQKRTKVGQKLYMTAPVIGLETKWLLYSL